MKYSGLDDGKDTKWYCARSKFVNIIYIFCSHKS
jgi:hypothetical protein